MLLNLPQKYFIKIFLGSPQTGIDSRKTYKYKLTKLNKNNRNLKEKRISTFENTKKMEKVGQVVLIGTIMHHLPSSCFKSLD